MSAEAKVAELTRQLQELKVAKVRLSSRRAVGMTQQTAHSEPSQRMTLLHGSSVAC